MDNELSQLKKDVEDLKKELSSLKPKIDESFFRTSDTERTKLNRNIDEDSRKIIKELITDANLITSDITTNDVSTSKHGFVPKAPNDTTKYLRGDGTWATIPIDYTVNTETGSRTYVTSQLIIDADLGWSITGTPTAYANGVSIASTSNIIARHNLLGRSNSYDNGLLFTSGIDLRISYWFTPISASDGASPAGAGDTWFFHGFTEETGSVSNNGNITAVTWNRIGFAHYNGKVYAVACNGTNIVATEVDATDDGQVKKHYIIDWVAGSYARFYINGTLVREETQYLATAGGNLYIYFGGYDGDGSTVGIGVSHVTLSETLS